jgi:putative hemolysin
MVEELLIIGILIGLNGVFSMSEVSIVTSRKSRLEEMLRRGNQRAKTVLQIADSPNRFLSTVQVGITSIGILNGIFAGATLSGQIAKWLASTGLSPNMSENLAVGLVVVAVTYFSIVVGELLPKRIGMTNPETIALLVARPMLMLSRATAPFVWLLSISTDFFVKLLNIKKHPGSAVTEDEIKALVTEGASVGAIQEIEQDIVERVFHLGDQRIAALMTSRSDLVWLDVNDDLATSRAKIAHHHSTYPLCERELDRVLGVVHSKDLLVALLGGAPLELRKYLKPVNVLPGSLKAYKALEKFKESKIHHAVVVDEYGAVEGFIVMNDILDALVGDITQDDTAHIVARGHDSWLIDGRLPFFEFLHEFGIRQDGSQAGFHTISGLVISVLKRIPQTGDKFEWQGYQFEIVDMDGNRIDKILLTSILPGA